MNSHVLIYNTTHTHTEQFSCTRDTLPGFHKLREKKKVMILSSHSLKNLLIWSRRCVV